MHYENDGHMDFFLEMSEYHISAREFFCKDLLDSLNRNFGWENVRVSYFDTKGKFLSWNDGNGLLLDSETHPYRTFAAKDVLRHMVYQDAVRDRLTYFNVVPRLYKSTDIIGPADYEQSAYVRFLEKSACAHYSVAMAFGINAYIQLTFFKTREQGDFTEEELEELKKIYVYVANFYKNFKKHEQTKIVSHIQQEIIASGEKAYLITDDFMHVMSYNHTAQDYLKEILGAAVAEQLDAQEACSWLVFLIGEISDADSAQMNRVQVREVKDFVFKIYPYDQRYSNGIVDRYHWITIAGKTKDKGKTISRQDEKKVLNYDGAKPSLTHTEKRVAELMYHGLTYKAIADELVVSYHTVKNHVQNIYTKCGVKSRFQLCEWLENQERE
ncbi:MAG: helix-turn-helix transcriptional regulator [Brotaphodocola sp.]